MSKGILISAHNNGTWDYVKFAALAYSRAKMFCDLPLCLVSDKLSIENYQGPQFWDDLVILDRSEFRPNPRLFDSRENVNFLNSSQIMSYWLSPWSETLVMDSDFLMMEPSLLSCFSSGLDFACNSETINDGPSFVSAKGPRQFWTTVMYFKKCGQAATFFNLCNHVRQNWEFYVSQYRLPSSLYRNDTTFALAAFLYGGRKSQNLVEPLPSRWYNLSERDTLLSLEDRALAVLNNRIISTKQNIHVMNKHSLRDFS
jgi:hypothetical protein